MAPQCRLIFKEITEEIIVKPLISYDKSNGNSKIYLKKIVAWEPYRILVTNNYAFKCKPQRLSFCKFVNFKQSFLWPVWFINGRGIGNKSCSTPED